jgi:hypothetical protein
LCPAGMLAVLTPSAPGRALPGAMSRVAINTSSSGPSRNANGIALRRVIDSGEIEISCATVSPVCVLSIQTV